MARDRKDIADREGAARTVASASASPADRALVGNREPPHPDLIRLVRLLARHTALTDIAAQRATYRPKE